MRLFFGLPFPHQARRDFLLAQKPLVQHSLRGNFTSAANFHLTLTFLGEVEEARLPTLFTLLQEVKHPPFDLLFTRLDHFDGGIWYLAPAPCPPLLTLEKDLTAALRREGFPLPHRPYIPHLTLGRKVVLKEGFTPSPALYRPIPARSEGLRLFLSHRVAGELRYDILTPGQ